MIFRPFSSVELEGFFKFESRAGILFTTSHGETFWLMARPILALLSTLLFRAIKQKIIFSQIVKISLLGTHAEAPKLQQTVYSRLHDWAAVLAEVECLTTERSSFGSCWVLGFILLLS